MTEKTRWDRLQKIFGVALEFDPEERRRHVEAACAGDPVLLREVEDLLADSDLLGDVLELPAVETGIVRRIDAEAPTSPGADVAAQPLSSPASHRLPWVAGGIVVAVGCAALVAVALMVM